MIALIGLIIIVWVLYKREKERQRELEELDRKLNEYYNERREEIEKAFKEIENKYPCINYEDDANNKE